MSVNIFGFSNDMDESLQGSQGSGMIQFGLNPNARVAFMEYNPNGGKDNTPADCVDIHVAVGSFMVKSRIYDLTGDLFHNGERISPNHPKYDEAYSSQMRQRLAVMVHVVKALGVPEEILAKEIAMKTPKSFAEYAKLVTGLLRYDYGSTPVDVFLEYEWTIRPNQDKTYLILPRNMKGGIFMCPMQEGTWKPIKDHNGLHYENEKGETHPFTRNQNYMDSPKANQQTQEGESWGSTSDSPIEGSKDSLSNW